MRRTTVGALSVLLLAVGCAPKPFSQPLDSASLASLGEAGTVKVFAVGDIDASPPSQVGLQTAPYTSTDPLTNNTSTVNSYICYNEYYTAYKNGDVPNGTKASDYQWDEIAKDPGKYLRIDSTEDKVLNDTVAFEGSGAVVSPDGLIVTNAHVVSDGSPADPTPDIPMFTSLITYLEGPTKIGPLPDDPQVVDSIKLSILRWLLENTKENFVFKEARIYLNDQSDTIDQRMKEASSNTDPAAMDAFFKSISVPSTILEKGDPWPGDDVAVLKVEAKNLISLPLADSSTIETGQTINCFGYPGAAIMSGMEAGDEFRTIFKPGSIGQTMPMQSGFNAYNISADINHGNSGGPVLNQYGQIIGLGTAGNPSDNGENYAVPVSLVKKYLDKANSVPSVGDETNSWIGGLGDLATHHSSSALQQFQKVADAQGATSGESVMPGTVNRWVVELIHNIQSSGK